jgi:DNA-binding NtrC family response regulator
MGRARRKAMNKNEYYILLVDDDPDVLTVFRRALEVMGFNVMSASGGASAIAHMRNNHFDMVITDMDMPGTDGMVVLRKSKELNPRRPVMIMTGRYDENAMPEESWKRADAFMLKPCSVYDFGKKVSYCLEEGKEENRALDANIVKEV